MLKIALGLPAYRGQIAAGQFRMWLQIGAAIARHKDRGEVDLVMMAEVDVCGIGRARNMLIAHAMKVEADWLLMVDSDTWAPGADLLRMILEAPVDCAVIGAAVLTRGDHDLNIYRWNADRRHHELARIERIESPPKIHQFVDGIGGAVMAINLHKIGNADFRWLHYPDGSSISEDLYFCRQIIEAGKKIVVDMRVPTYHVDRPATLHYDGQAI